MSVSKFQKGVGVYCCEICERRTRTVDRDAAVCRLCAECYEYAGIENMLSDGGEDPELRAQLEVLKARIEALGGDITRL